MAIAEAKPHMVLLHTCAACLTYSNATLVTNIAGMYELRGETRERLVNQHSELFRGTYHYGRARPKWTAPAHASDTSGYVQEVVRNTREAGKCATAGARALSVSWKNFRQNTSFAAQRLCKPQCYDQFQKGGP